MRTGEYIQIASGQKFWPLDPHPDDVFIEDIAHALAFKCRFSGHTSEFYSVAQHSVMVSLWCHPEHALCGLLHDAAEAYLVDLPRPLKKHSVLGAEFNRAEDKLLRVIFQRFALPEEIPEDVHQADTWMLCAEARDFMGNPDWAMEYRATVVPPLEKVPSLAPWDPLQARLEFLLRFYRLIYHGVNL